MGDRDGSSRKRESSRGAGRGRGTPGRPQSAYRKDKSSPSLLEGSPYGAGRSRSEGQSRGNSNFSAQKSSQRGKFSEYLDKLDVKDGLNVRRNFASTRLLNVSCARTDLLACFELK